MNNHFEEFIAVIKSLQKHNVKYVLIGGVAVVLYGLERMTADMDIIIKMTSKNINNLKDALHDIFQDTAIEEITLEELNEYPVIRYGTPNDFYIDIMTRIGEVANYDNLESQVIQYKGTSIIIATPETLFRLKYDTIREKDKIDALFLKELIHYQKSNKEK